MLILINKQLKKVIMEPKSAIENLEESDEYISWRKTNKNAYIANCFVMMEDNKIPEWHIGFYDTITDKITTFVVSTEIKKLPESDVFKEKDVVLPLEFSKVKVKLNQAIENAVELQEKEHKGNPPMKTIVLLQNFEGHHIYNITFVTRTFKTLNVKVSSQDGRILSHKIHSIMDFDDKNYK